MPELWWAYLLIGAGVGFLAGLLGIGGGMLQVPLMVLVFTAKGFPAEHLMHMSLATAMATIPFTSASSVTAHHLHGNVDWLTVRRMIAGLIAGAGLGALSTGLIPGRPLAVFFTFFLFYAAINMLLNLKPRSARSLPGRGAMAVVGAAIGFTASLLAAGAAFITIPFMTWCGVGLKRAIGTAAAVGFPLSVAASVGYVLAGSSQPGLPQYSLGYVYLPALAMIVIASVPMAPLGAKVSARVPVKPLRWFFAAMLLTLAVRMLVTIW